MKNKIRKIVSRLCIIAGILMICSAIIFIIYNNSEDNKAEKENNNSVASIKDYISSNSEGDLDEESEVITDQVMPELKYILIDGNYYIGYLSIPAIDMEYSVMADWDYEKLKTAPCRYYGAVDTKDLVIAGHNYKSVFGKLKNLKKDDEIYFTDANGITYKYLVDLVDILEPTDIENMINSPFDLSLYTCTYGGKQRVTVRCHMVTE